MAPEGFCQEFLQVKNFIRRAESDSVLAYQPLFIMYHYGAMGGLGGNRAFEAHYRAMPLAFIDKQQAEHGDKVILPPSALDRLASLSIEYPMLFNVTSASSGRSTHCGVLEFVAEEGVVYMPHWMMQNLLLQVGDMVKFKNVSLPKGTYVKIQPVTSDFLDISNPKAVLEHTLRKYTCLTVGDVFVVHYNNKNYEIEVKEAKPQKAISVVETDCQVDFEAPKDYKEPEKVFAKPPPPKPSSSEAPNAPAIAPSAKGEASAPEPEGPSFLPFAGQARRLDGKPTPVSSQPVPAPASQSNGATTSKNSSVEPSNASGGKNGTFVSTGNRLLDKIMKEKGQVPGPAAASAPSSAAAQVKEEEPKSSFTAFKGQGYSLK